MKSEYIFKRKIVDESTMESRFENEIVSPEIYGWEAMYNDNTSLKQFDDDGFFHQIAEVDQNKVVVFAVYKLENPAVRFDLVVIPEIHQIFMFYRNTITKAGDSETRVRIPVFGLKTKGTGETIYNYILPDGRLVVATCDCLQIN